MCTLSKKQSLIFKSYFPYICRKKSAGAEVCDCFRRNVPSSLHNGDNAHKEKTIFSFMAQYILVRAVWLIRSQWQLTRFAMPRFPRVSTHTVYSAVLGFWPEELSNGRLGASHWCSDRVIFSLLLSATVTTVDLVTLKFQANLHPPLATSRHPAGPSASSSNSSTGQKPCTAIYLTFAINSPTNKSHTWRHILLKRSLFLWPH